MIDKREQILVRIHAVLASIVSHVFRNRLEFPDELLPAIVLLDGDESTDEGSYARKGRTISQTPCIMRMNPEIYLFTQDSDNDALVGTKLNELRLKVLDVILNDETLIALAMDGDIRYLGFSTGLALGRSLTGEGGMEFTIAYVLKPNNL